MSILNEVKNGLDMNSVIRQAIHDLGSKMYEPAQNDKEKVLLLVIDAQNDFMDLPNSALPVTGSMADMDRLLEWMDKNLSKITSIATTLDSHNIHQIFHPVWWQDPDGINAPPFTVISLDDVTKGKWIPMINPTGSIQYISGLESQPSKKKLCIWNTHCLIGTWGHELEERFAKMAHYHSIVRQTQIIKELKGANPMTENYGVVKPEFSVINEVNMKFINKLSMFNKVVISGQALSHCVLESLKQILEYATPDLAQNIILLTDTSSSIQGFEADTNTALEDLKNKYGIKLETTTTFNL